SSSAILGVGHRGGLGPRHVSRYARRGNQSQSRQRRSRTSSGGTAGDRLDETGARFPRRIKRLIGHRRFYGEYHRLGGGAAREGRDQCEGERIVVLPGPTDVLWFHVDGAIGAPLAISDKLQPMLHGMERADSLAFDLHKWMQMPYDVGCVLVRDEAQHREAFSEGAGYLSRMPRGLCSGERWFS